jgi:deoxyribodipyrimidine photolyase
LLLRHLSAWIGAFDEDRIIDFFNIPDRHRPQAILLFGYPQEIPDTKELKALEDVVFFNTFGNRVHRPHLVFYDWATEWRQQAHKIKGHAANVIKKLPGHKQDTAPAQPGDLQHDVKSDVEQQPSGLKQARERVQRVIESLKREEHRKKL